VTGVMAMDQEKRGRIAHCPFLVGVCDVQGYVLVSGGVVREQRGCD
jgi:hypothetical protein